MPGARRLSEEEQRRWDELAARLAQDAPDLAAKLQAGNPPRRLVLLAVAFTVTGALLLVAGLVSTAFSLLVGLPTVTVGAVVLALGLFRLARCWPHVMGTVRRHKYPPAA